MSIFVAVKEMTATENKINEDIKKVKDLSVSLDPNKQAQEFISSRKFQTRFNIAQFFNDIPVNQGITQRYSAMILDSKLSFEEHLEFILAK